MEKLEKLQKEYEVIKRKLEELASEGMINEFYKKTIMDMSERVIMFLARNYEKIKEGVGAIMSGKVLDYEAKRIRNEADRIRMEKDAKGMYEEGLKPDAIARIQDISVEAVEAILGLDSATTSAVS